jgi:hypothetical protein
LTDSLHDKTVRLIGKITSGLAVHRHAEGVGETLARLAEHDRAGSRAIVAKQLPACRFLPAMLREVRAIEDGLAAAIAEVADDLYWRQNPNYSDEAMGQPGYMENYAYAELIGPSGPIEGDDFLLGLMILGPHMHYLDHYHPAPELYWLLTGPSDWKAGAGGFVPRIAGETVWHQPFRVHATRTSDTPLLTVWAWTRNVSEPARLVGG